MVRLNTMQGKQIEAFKNVVLHGSYANASRIMSVTQPRISTLISNLENQIGFLLFTSQRPRGSVPTPGALRFYQAVEKHYFGLDQLEQLVQKIAKEQPPDLCLCATHALASYFFPPALKVFSEKHPRVDLIVECRSSTEIVSRLENHLIHIGILPAFPERPDVIQKPLITAAHVCALPQDHPLAAKQNITAEDLEGEIVLNVLPSGLSNWEPLTDMFEKHKPRNTRSIGIQNSHTAYSLVSAGLGIGILEPFASHAWLKNGVVVRPYEPEITFDYVVALSNEQMGIGCISDFVDMIQNVAQAY